MGLPKLKVKRDINAWGNSCLIITERLIKITNPPSAAISSHRRALDSLTATELDIIEDY